MILGNTTQVLKGLPLPKFSKTMRSAGKKSAAPQASGKQGGVGARTQDHRGRKSNERDSLGKFRTLSGLAFGHLRRGRRKLIQTSIPLVPPFFVGCIYINRLCVIYLIFSKNSTTSLTLNKYT